MRNFLSEKIINMPQSGIRKFFDIVNTRKDCLPLVVGEPDFITSPEVRQAAIDAINAGKTQYTSNWGTIDVRKALVKYLNVRFNLDYSPEKEIFVTVGASEAIDLAFRATIEAGDEVLIPEPGYIAYAPCAIMCGGVPKTVHTNEAVGFTVTPENLKAAITPKSKILILPYPSNPTGAIMSEAELRALAPIIIEHDLLVISDEIYAELTYGQRHFSFAAIEGMKERTIFVSSFSKSFAMTGWRVGYVAAPYEMCMQMIKIKQYTSICPSSISQAAATAALEIGLRTNFSDVEYMREKYDERRKLLHAEFNRMGLKTFEPKGAFYVFPCIASTGLTGNEFAIKLLDDQKVATVPGDAFGPSGTYFVRVSYAYSIENLKEGLSRIEKFANSCRKTA